VKQYEQMAHKLALGMVDGPETARELPQLSHAPSFASWLYGIVLNVCRTYWRNRKLTVFSLDALPGGLHFDALPFTSGEPGPQEIAETHELATQVLAAVNALSPKNREATLLFYYEQLSLYEIAALLGISVTAVKGRLHKSRLQLRDLLVSLMAPLTDNITSQERKNAMLKVTIADVIREEENENYVIVLIDEAGERILPIWIGPFEAQSIAMHLLNHATARPMTFDFIVRLLDAVDATLEEVRIETFQEITYYAVVKLRSGSTVQEVDARPSDAIALALRMNCPIYVAEDVMANAGEMIPVALRNTPLRKGLATLAEHLAQQRQESEQKIQALKEKEAS